MAAIGHDELPITHVHLRHRSRLPNLSDRLSAKRARPSPSLAVGCLVRQNTLNSRFSTFPRVMLDHGHCLQVSEVVMGFILCASHSAFDAASRLRRDTTISRSSSCLRKIHALRIHRSSWGRTTSMVNGWIQSLARDLKYMVCPLTGASSGRSRNADS